MNFRARFYGALCILFFTTVWSVACAAEETASIVAEPDFFAIVGGQTIPVEEFQAAFRKGVREKFYHGKVSRSEVESFRKEVVQRLVNKTLLVQEARRRKLGIDSAQVAKELDDVDKRYSASPEWAKSRDGVLKILKERIEGDALLKALESNVRAVSEPTDKQLRDYYDANKEKFTAPQQWDVSLILLKVDPSSPSEVWSAAADEAASLVERIRNGADFADLARIHSGDESAENGGNMGYQHIGMLARPAQNVLALMAPGEVSEPVVLLQGVAVFRLEDIKKPRLNPYEKVAHRTKELWLREQGDKSWGELLRKLQAETSVEYGRVVLEPLAETNG